MSFVSLVSFGVFFCLTMILGSVISVGMNAMIGGEEATGETALTPRE